MKVHLFLIVGLTLAGCAPAMPGDSLGGDRVPPVPVPMAPPQPMTVQGDQGNVPGIVERHAVANRSDCDEMAQQFKLERRRVRLVARRWTPGKALQWTCEFQGEDAQEGYFEDHRYNRPDEYTSP